MKVKLISWIFALVLMGLLFNSCRDEPIFTGDNAMISISTDTITFDTVFTQRGTTTKFFKIYNDEEQAIMVDEINLVDRTGHFRINVDGTPGSTAENVRIGARDSLYVFVEATVDPNQTLEISPYFLEDMIDITVDGAVTRVKLIAWGQDANYVPGIESRSPSGIAVLSCDFGEVVWDDPKPYVIYGSLFIDECTLVLPPGTEIYVHGGVAINDFGVYTSGLIYFLENGIIRSEGTEEEPVTILSDRLEEDFQDVPGQWFGVVLDGSRGNLMEHTTIRHSLTGVRVDSNSTASFIACEFGHTGASGIIARHADIYMENCLMHNNGGAAIAAEFGGNYELNNCTMVNYNNQDEALQLANFECLNMGCSLINQFPMNAILRNCLILGNEPDEIAFADAAPEDPSQFTYRMENCFVQVDELLEPERFPDFFNNCTDCLNNPAKDTLFINMDEYDFRLDTMSLPINAGRNLPFVTSDFDGNLRSDGAYDVGCFEFQN